MEQLGSNSLHQHQEIQISIFVEGEGTYIIGDCVGEFKKNDIFVIGENLPHIFKRDAAFEQETVMISLFFSKNSYGEHFFNLPEFEHFNAFLMMRNTNTKPVLRFPEFKEGWKIQYLIDTRYP